jgi:hypothetical protein
MTTRKWKRPNAYKHGAFSATAILPGEDEREFDELHASLIEEWMPEGATEEDAVLSIAKAVWRKRRVQRFLTVQSIKFSGDPQHSSYNESVGLQTYAAFLRENPTTDFNVAKRILHPDRIKHFDQKFPRSRFPSISEWVQAVLNEIESLLAEQRADPEVAILGNLYLSSKMLLGDLFKQELSLDERLDAMIDRAVKRLIQTKAMKEMLGRTSPEARQPKKIAPKKD